MTIYRPVPGFVDLYAGMDGTIVKAGYGELPQKLYKSTRYRTVCIPKGGHRSTRFVHQLVASAFLGERAKGIVTRHGAGGELDNSIGNLCYGTQRDNQHDSIACGTHMSVANSNKTHCKHRHEFTPENTYVSRRGRRECRTCMRARGAARRARVRAE